MSHQALFLGTLPVDTVENPKIFEVKTENIFTGRLIVEKNLPANLAQGLFALPGKHGITVQIEPVVLAMTIGSIATGMLKLAIAENAVPNHPMDAVYYSQAPLLHGDRPVDFCIVPSSPGLLALKQHPFSPENPVALREATLAFFQYNPAEFDFKIKATTPGLDYCTVGRLIIPARVPSEATAQNFSPSHTLAA